VGLVVLVGVLSASCDKMPLTAPLDSQITLVAASTFVQPGGTTEVSAFVIEPAGTPVHNGTVVTFTTTLGTLDPIEARTNGGKATVRFHAGGSAGIARIRAFSGGTSFGSGGDAGDPLEIRVGAAGATRVTLVLSPSALPSRGGTADVLAVVTDDDNRRLSGVPVVFRATAGTLRDTQVTTDANGEARTTITTTRETEVTASVGTATDSQTLTVSTRPQISITAAVQADTLAFTFTITTTVDATNPIRSASISFGDGSSQSLGSLSGTTTVSHRYEEPGTYVVTVVAIDSEGDRVEAVTSVVARELEEPEAAAPPPGP
jgi:Bacterial Ig-like domain (group 1)